MHDLAVNGHLLTDEDPEVGDHYWCENCMGRVSKTKLRDGTWPAEIGQWCPEYLYLMEGPIPDDRTSTR